MKKIKLMDSTFYNELETKKALCDFILGSNKLSMGQEVEKWETEFRIWHERKFAIAFNSGSSANLALFQSLINMGILAPGDPIAFSCVTWATNVMPIIQMGLRPIAVDIELNTLNVSLNYFKKAHEKHRFKAFFITNLLGFCSDLPEIAKYCLDNKIYLLEDNCESLGSKIDAKLLGNFSLASTFSTFVGHHLSTIEGGFVCTDDEALKNELLMVRAHGWSRNLPKSISNELIHKNNISSFYESYTFYRSAYNLRPTEINGFLGINQIKYLDHIISTRESNFKFINKNLLLNESIYKLDCSHMSTISNFAYPIIFKNKDLLNFYLEKFNKFSIEVRPIVGGNIMNQPFFRNYIYQDHDEITNGNIVHENGLYFPNNPSLGEVDFKYILNNVFELSV
jgi:CDP-6-deoxy-D-xylo-4-hexulose-3-dehydrase